MKAKNLLIFSFGRKFPWLIKQIIKNSKKYTKTIIISYQKEWKELEHIQNIEVVNPRKILNQQIFENRFQITNDFINQISKKVLSDKSISKCFQMAGTNLWWFLPNRIFSLITTNDTLTNASIISEAIEKFKPSMILYENSSNNANLIQYACKKYEISYQTNYYFFKSIKNNFEKLIYKLFSGLKRIHNVKKIANWAKAYVKSIEAPNPELDSVLFISQEKANRFEYNIKGKLERHDVYQKNIQLKLRELDAFNYFSIELIYRLEQIPAFDKIHNELTDTIRIPIYNYYTKKIAQISKKTRSILSKKLKKLFADEKFKDAFMFNEFSLIDIYKFQLFRTFLSELTAGYENYHMYKKALSDIDPKVFIHYNEHSIFGRAAIMVARSMKIPILALQHGNISFASNGYFFSKDLICEENLITSSANCYHLSTKVSVYGINVKDLLIKHAGYPKERVVVTGCPRWDIIQNKKCFDKQSFCNELKLNPAKPIVVILSQAFHNRKRREYFYNEVLNALKLKFKDIQVIWKPHPREISEEIEKLVMHYDLKNIIIEKNLPLYDVLNVANVAITINSTAGFEALLFDKPLITLIPEGEDENEMFKGSGAVLKVDDHKGLMENLYDVLNDPEKQKDLKEKRKKMLHSYIKFDGKASTRNAELISEMINANKKNLRSK